MKKTTKKTPSKASHKTAVKDLDVKPTKGGTIRGGIYGEKLGTGSGGGGTSGGGSGRPKGG